MNCLLAWSSNYHAKDTLFSWRCHCVVCDSINVNQQSHRGLFVTKNPELQASSLGALQMWKCDQWDCKHGPSPVNSKTKLSRLYSILFACIPTTLGTELHILYVSYHSTLQKYHLFCFTGIHSWGVFTESQNLDFGLLGLNFCVRSKGQIILKFQHSTPGLLKHRQYTIPVSTLYSKSHMLMV